MSFIELNIPVDKQEKDVTKVEIIQKYMCGAETLKSGLIPWLTCACYRRLDYVNLITGIFELEIERRKLCDIWETKII